MTSLLLTGDQREFAATVRQMLHKHDCRQFARAGLDSPQPYPDVLHRDLAAMGVFGVAAGAAAGGLDLGLQDLTVIAEQLGAALAPTTFLSAALAARLLTRLPDSSPAQELLPGVAAGTQSLGVVLAPDTDGLELDAGPGTREVSGRLAHVVDGPALSGLLLQIGTGERAALVHLDLGAEGVDVRPLVSVDGSRQFATVQLSDVAVDVLAEGVVAVDVARAVLHDGWVLVAADALGGARNCLDITVAYAASRFQFGRAIGSFQAVKHRLANMLVAVETAESAVRYSAWALAAGAPDGQVAARVAKAVASEAFLDVATGSVQIHGGNGFTWEFDTHLFLRRAQSGLTLLGDPALLLDELADELGLPAA